MRVTPPFHESQPPLNLPPSLHARFRAHARTYLARRTPQIKGFAFVNAYSMSIMLTTPFVMVMLTLVVFFNVDGDFSPDVVFTAVSLLLVIRFPLMMLPMAVASWVQGKVRCIRMVQQ